MRPRQRNWMWVALVAVLVGACASGNVTDDGTAVTSTSSEVADSGPPEPERNPADCPDRPGEAWREDGSVDLRRIGGEGGIEVYAAEYPLPGETQGLWSQWGQGIVTSDGRHLSAVGDHLGPDGNSYLFEYDPDARTLTRFMDVLTLVDHQDGAWGYGKIHAQMVEGPCETVWAYTYWGTRNDLRYENGYAGDVLLEIDPTSETVTNHGAVAGEAGVPTMAATGDGKYLLVEAVDPDTDVGRLVAYDMVEGTVVGEVDDPAPQGHRALAVDTSQRFLYTVSGTEMAAYDPSGDSVTEVPTALPGEGPDDFLRAVTPPGPDGDIYGIMQDERTFFVYRPDGSLEMLAPSDGYTASIAVTESGDRLFWLPDAHGSAWETGAVVRSLDTSTGEVTEVVSLLDMFREELDLYPGGTYSASFADGRLIMGLNAAHAQEDSGFGTVVLVVIEGLAG